MCLCSYLFARLFSVQLRADLIDIRFVVLLTKEAAERPLVDKLSGVGTRNMVEG